MARFPAVFVSHGPPTIVTDDSPARRFLTALGAELGRPEAVLAVSAHWETPGPTVSTARRPGTIHDFHGFPPALYETTYPAPGAPEVAERAAKLLEAAGFAAARDPVRGLDHGAWTPLALIYPEADVPVAQLSIQTPRGPGHHHHLGSALRALREDGVLVLGSGNLTHNLGAFRGGRPDAPAPPWVAAFATWMAEAITAGRLEDLLDYRGRAPHGADNHPSEDHLLPLFAALGAGAPDGRGERVHASTLYGVLAMDAYLFA